MKGKERLLVSTQSGYTAVMHTREQVLSALKLQELVKKRIPFLKEVNELLNHGRDRDSGNETIAVLQFLVEESEK